MAENGYKLEKTAKVEIDPSKLSNMGHQLIGGIGAMERWSAMFKSFADQTDDIIEKKILTDVAEALAEDCRNAQIALISEATKCGAAVPKKSAIITDDLQKN